MKILRFFAIKYEQNDFFEIQCAQKCIIQFEQLHITEDSGTKNPNNGDI